MFSMFHSRQAKKALAAAAVMGLLFAVAGCSKGGQKPQAQGAQATLVKSMQVVKRDTPMVYEYSGFVQANQEMELKAQVNGQITGKFFKGGDTVQRGQVLYTIDARTYQAALLNAQATYNNAAADAERYTTLYKQNAISKQTLDNALTFRDQAKAALINAEVNMSETKVTAPFTGRIDTNAMEVGNYVVAGQTPLAKMSDTNPVYATFSVAEPEYLKLSGSAKDSQALNNLKLILSDGSTYGYTGKVAEVNRGISNNTGTVTVKAVFENPNRRLLPGMFAHVRAEGEVRKDAILVPQRSIVEMLYKKFVFVIGADKKVKMTEITTGQTVGRYFMVESGLKGDEVIVVEGTGKIRNDAVVKDQPITEKDLDTSDVAAQAKK